MSRKYLPQIKSEEIEFQGIFRISNIVDKTTKSGNPFKSFEIADREGSLSLNQFNIDSTNWVSPEKIEAYGIAYVKFEPSKNNGRTFWNATYVEGVDQAQIDLSELLNFDPTENSRLMKKIIDYIDTEISLSDQPIEARPAETILLSDIATRVAHQYFKDCTLPAAIKMHDETLNGLIRHTYKMMQYAVLMKEALPEVNMPLLLTGILIHDLGKIMEYKTDPFGFASGYTRRGVLITHQIDGARILDSIISEIEQERANYAVIIDDDIADLSIGDYSDYITLDGSCFAYHRSEKDQEIIDLLQHMIVSHHGKPEYGSSVTPKFLEAALLHKIDSLDADVKMFLKAEKDLQPGEVSTRSVFGLDTKVYRPTFR